MRLGAAIDSVMNRVLPIEWLLAHFGRRLLETAMAVSMIGVGATFHFSPDSLSTSSMHYLLAVMPSGWWAAVAIIAGVARIVALMLNGHWMPQGAYTRAIGAAVGSIFWAQWAGSLLQLHLDGRPLSPGVIPYAVLAAFESVSFFVALSGAKHARSREMGDRLHRSNGAYPPGKFAGLRGSYIDPDVSRPEGPPN